MADQSKKYISGAYNGEDPFIFISYAHRDRGQAMEIIEHLIGSSCRVWFDQGITPGSEWDSNIAKHVEKCRVFFALLSKAYLESGNCQDELNYARENKCRRILIYLEDVELSGGLRMRLGQLPQYRKYESADPEQFYEALLAADGVSDCLTEEGPVSDDPPPMRDEPKEPSAQPSKQKSRVGDTVRRHARKFLLAGVLCGILFAAWAGLSYRKAAQLEKQQNEIYFYLKPTEEMDEASFAEAKEVLTERLRTLSGNDRLQLTEDGQTLTGELPLTLGGEEAVDEAALSETMENDILSGGGLGANFDYYLEFPKNWEDVGEIENAGENQKNYDEISSPYVTVEYRLSSDVRTGELQDLLTNLKYRLDALEQPYSIAVEEADTEEERSIWIRTGTARMGEPVLEALEGDSFRVESSLGKDSLYLSTAWYFGHKFSREKDGDGTCRIVVQASKDRDCETLQELSKEAGDEGDGRLYLLLGDYRVASADITGEITDGKVAFTRLCAEGADPITEEQEWYLNLLERRLNRPLSEYLGYQDVVFGSLADQTFDEDGTFGFVADASWNEAAE